MNECKKHGHFIDIQQTLLTTLSYFFDMLDRKQDLHHLVWSIQRKRHTKKKAIAFHFFSKKAQEEVEMMMLSNDIAEQKMSQGNPK